MANHRAYLPDARWKPSPDIASRKVADEVVLLNVKTSDYYSMNPVAVLVWDLIGRNKSLEEIVGAVTAEFDADSGKVRKDVMALLKNLESEHIIIRSA